MGQILRPLFQTSHFSAAGENKKTPLDEIIEKIGKPTIYVSKVNCGELTYLNNKLDEHLITIELYGLELSYISIDG